MSEFKRELRYVVFKLKDLDSPDLPRLAKEKAQSALEDAVYRFGIIRERLGTPEREYVVVENDWPEYEIVWDMIRARVEGRPNRIQELETELATLKANMPVVVGYMCERAAKKLLDGTSVCDLTIIKDKGKYCVIPIYLDPPKEVTDE